MRVTGLAAGMGGNWEAALLHYRSLDVPFTFPLQICIPHYINALTRALRGLEQSNQAVHDHGTSSIFGRHRFSRRAFLLRMARRRHESAGFKLRVFCVWGCATVSAGDRRADEHCTSSLVHFYSHSDIFLGHRFPVEVHT